MRKQDYETLDAEIDALVAHQGYPFGFVCYGAFSPHHSFEWSSHRCRYCGKTMEELKAAFNPTDRRAARF